MAYTYETGELRTDYFSTLGNDVRDVAPSLMHEYADEAPFLVVADKIAQKGKASNIKVEHYEQGRNSREATIGTYTTGVAVPVGTGEGKYFSENDVLLNPVRGNTARVVSVSGDTITFSEDPSGFTNAWVTGDKIYRLGKAVEENGTVSESVHVLPDSWFNYIQQFDQSLDMSWLALNTVLHGEPNPEKTRFTEAMKDFMRSINLSWLFGRRKTETLSSGRYVYYQNGIEPQITTNSLDCSTLTEAAFRKHLATIKKYGGSRDRYLVGSPDLIAMIEGWGLADRYLTDTTKSDQFGFEVTKYRNPYFNLYLLIDYSFSEVGKEDTAFLLDFSAIRIREMIGRKILRNVGERNKYGKLHALYWANCIEVMREWSCSKLINIPSA